MDIVTRLRQSVDIASILAILGAFSYITAYGFEVGYLRVFGINYQSAEVQPVSFIVSLVVVLGMFICLYSIFGDDRDWSKRSSFLRKLFEVGGFKIIPPWRVLIVVGFFIALFFIFLRDITLLGLVLAAAVALKHATWILKRSDNPARKVWAKLVVVLVIAFFAFLTFVAIGILFAHAEQTYKVIDTKNGQALIVREYGSKLISAKFEEKALTGLYGYTPNTEQINFHIENILLSNKRSRPWLGTTY